MPSWMRAPPESLMPTTGAPTLMAWSITLEIFWAAIWEREPPRTVKSWAYPKTVRPSTLPQPVTTESPSKRCLSSPRSVDRWVLKVSISVNLPSSKSFDRRSRAVSLPRFCCDSMRRSPPPSLAVARRDANAERRLSNPLDAGGMSAWFVISLRLRATNKSVIGVNVEFIRVPT